MSDLDSPMTADEIAEAKALCEAATPGEWTIEPTWIGDPSLGRTIVRQGPGGCDFVQLRSDADAVLFHRARPTILRLLRALAVRDEEIERLRSVGPSLSAAVARFSAAEEEVDRLRAVHASICAQVDQTDPNCPIGAALTRAGLAAPKGPVK